MTTRNPWKKRITEQKQHKSTKHKAGSTSSKAPSTGSLRHAEFRVKQARQRLFDAGWTPAMMSLPVSDDLAALLKLLNKRNVELAECRIRKLEHERH